MPEYDDDDLDYMHPFGKPEEKGEEIREGDDMWSYYRSVDHALHDADGHSLKKPDPFLGPEAAMQPNGHEPDQLKP